ncbi:hypothetical protein AB0J83_40815 [Actinoplanes sp. NPDC049596]|uniref:hypothetical protein n=1 Tax=unclassified Actinoplanes TaxID=2626549 RepID=UPI00343B53FE
MAIDTVETPTYDDPPTPDATPSAPTTSTATRYLSVGAYADPYFRGRCLREVYHQPRRFVAPSYGFDLGAVLWHCLRARRLAIGRDAAIVLALLVTAVLDWRALAVVVVALIALRTTRTAKDVAGERMRQWRAATPGTPIRSNRRTLIILGGWAAAWIVLSTLAATMVLLDPQPLLGLPQVAGVAWAAVALVFALPTLFSLWREKRSEEFASDRPMPATRLNARLRDIEGQQGANTVIYSDFEPFIGAGDIFSNWGFAVRLVRKQSDLPDAGRLTEGEREFRRPPFTAQEIVDYVRARLQRLTTGESETRIPDLTVTDRVFLSAREEGHRSLTTDPEHMREIIRNPTQPARHYLVCQVVSWGGEVVTTVHVHIAVQGRSLYLEVTTTLMAPCNERYRIVDLEGGRGSKAWIRALATGLRETSSTITWAPGRLVLASAEAIGLRNSRRGRRTRRLTDRGAQVSVRQLGTKDKLRNFTQEQDVLKFRRLIENRVYAHVLDFLDQHDVDTTEYRARSASVFNVGMINHGEATVNGDVSGTSNQTAPAES